MKAYLNSVRIAPKKANIVAMMVRGMPVSDAATALSKTNKKAARLIEQLLKSAVSNAEHNDKQSAGDLVIKSIIVNQAQGYHRGVPKARGQMRPMRKFLSHISLTLGVAKQGVNDSKESKEMKKKAPKASQKAKTPVQKSQPKAEGSSDSSVSAASESSPSLS